jgi:hypothetical protein
MAIVRDIDFSGLRWPFEVTGDMGTVADRQAFRQLVLRWLLTEPAGAGETEEETETRRRYQTGEERASGYHAPAGERMLACLPWSPAWGAGIKRFLNVPGGATLATTVETRVRSGLGRLPGVQRVLVVRASLAGSVLTVAWSVELTGGSKESGQVDITTKEGAAIAID